MKKLTKKLMLSILTVALTFIALGTSTFAWFSMNQTVTVDGMTVHTQVGNYLMIKEDTLGSTTRIADNLFTSSVTDTKSALLEPVSTKTGKNFFYTLSGSANGDSTADDYKAFNAAEVPTTQELNAFNDDYGTTDAVGYVDYVFQLKAVNAANANKDIKITRLDLIYASEKDSNKAYRVAIFVEDLGETGTAPAGGSGTLKGIYAPSGSTNQTANYAVGEASTAPSALASNYNSVGNIATVTAQKTNYYKVVVRLYLEGEDTTCTNDTFASLTANWALFIELSIDTASKTNTEVSCLGKYTTHTFSGKTYYCDGTSAYKQVEGKPDTTALTSAACTEIGDSGLEADLETAFGITIS